MALSRGVTMSTRKWIGGLCRGLAIVPVLFLSSCLGIGVQTVFNEDGSGRMTVEFRVSQALLQMGEEETGIDIPLSKDDLMAEYENVDGVTVVEVAQEDTEEDRIITAVVDFDDFNMLSSDGQFMGEGATLEVQGDRTVLRMLIGELGGGDDGETIGEAEQPEMDDAMKSMVQSFLEGYELVYRVVAPRKITSHSDGELQSDGRTVVYSMAMGDLIMIEEPFYLKIVW